MGERRSTQRIQVSYPILYLVQISEAEIGPQKTGTVLDISLDGMMFESNEQIKTAKIVIRPSCNNEGGIQVEGFTVYSIPYFNGKYRSGLRFTRPYNHVEAFVAEVQKACHK